MWKQTLLAITTLTALTVSAQARLPHEEVHAAIGGLITGVVLSEIADHTNVQVHVSSRNRGGWDRYDSDYRDYDRSRNHYNNRNPYHNSRDHFVWEKRRVWVPAHWDYVRDRRGYQVKVWVKGRYEIRNVKVRVNNNRYDRDGYNRGDRHCR